ncbi:MAG: hypothetical protein HFJ04_10340 [Lachnospiraceae bacterium]|nr:hypothetical protein [Lachnospiraceae bacterium]
MPEDSKEAKKAAKQAKKEEKARKKEEKRRQKLAKAGATPEEIQRAMEYSAEYEEEGGSRLAVFFVTLVIIVIWLAILALLVKMDVGGFGSTVLQPLLKDVPYVNRILPEAEGEEVKSTESTETPYATLDAAVARIKELEVELQNAQNATADSQSRNEELQEQSQQLEQYKANEAAFEEQKQKFYEEVVFSDQAPDIDEYKKYYESIDPATAEALYKQVVEQQQGDEELEKYVSMYSSMKPKQAAAIFDTMTNDLKLVAKILKAMDADASSSILGAMNSDTAAKLTKIMEPTE